MAEQKSPKGFRVLTLFAVPIVLALIVAGLVIFWPSGGGDDKPDNDEPQTRSFELSKADMQELDDRSNEILRSTGTFGLKEDDLTNNNLQSIGYTVTRQDTGWDSYVTTRGAAYDSIRDLVMRDSPADYARSETASWPLGDEIEDLKTFTMNNHTVNVPKTGTAEVSSDGDDPHYVRIPVTFDSTVTQRLVTAEDTSWDGSYRVLTKNFHGSGALVFREYAGEWLLYDVEKPNNEFLTALWEPDFSSEYNDQMFGFRETEILTPDKPYTPPTEEDGK